MRNRRDSPLFRRTLWMLAVLACCVAQVATAAQPPKPAGSSAEVTSVDELITAARARARELRQTEPQPAWSGSAAHRSLEALWQYSRAHALTSDGGQATIEALKILHGLGRHEEIRQKVDEMTVQEPIWADAAWVLIEEAEATGSFDYFVEKAQRVAKAGPDKSLDARLWYTIGRVLKERGELGEAGAAYRRSADLATDADLAAAARGAIYEMGNLNPGQPAPPFTAMLLGGKSLSLEALRGKVVVLEFWGST